MKELELLAPARNADIGIAAIDCGADAVYMAGPGFGARQAAGNSVEEVARLCSYAHRFGARVFATVNTIVFDSELEEFASLLRQLEDAGVDALILQDMAGAVLADGRVPLHASTQCAIRDAVKAKELADMGFSRLILERELSLEQIRSIARAVPECELECFVHGALCVCYSGQCYLSEHISSRSANRGACIQACRSRYDLVDRSGKVLVKDKALLSLKDLRLLDRLGDLAAAGVTSFKIEGRLKNESYVRNVVRQYSLALDALVASSGAVYCRASRGRVSGAFTPALDKTFNRGYTELFLDGEKKPGWAAMDAAKGMGERIGKVISVRKDSARGSCVLDLECGVQLGNGDGFSFVAGNGDVIGFRGDVCENPGRNRARIVCKNQELLYKGAILYRNLDSAFEKEIARAPGRRLLDVKLDLVLDEMGLHIDARSEDGRLVHIDRDTASVEEARNRERLEALVKGQLCKSSDIYSFGLGDCRFEAWPLLSAAQLNALRRELADALSAQDCIMRPLLNRKPNPGGRMPDNGYRDNAANRSAANIYGKSVEDAYELLHNPGAELMRSRYCIRRELGLCPRPAGQPEPAKPSGQPGHVSVPDTLAAEPLYLLNNGRRLQLIFDCRHCEMVVKAE